MSQTTSQSCPSACPSYRLPSRASISTRHLCSYNDTQWYKALPLLMNASSVAMLQSYHLDEKAVSSPFPMILFPSSQYIHTYMHVRRCEGMTARYTRHFWENQSWRPSGVVVHIICGIESQISSNLWSSFSLI